MFVLGESGNIQHPHQPYEMTWDKLGASFSQNKFRYREQLGWSLKRNAEFMKHFMCLTASFKFYKGFEMAGLCSRIRLHQTLNGYNLKKKLNNYLSSSSPSNLLNLFSCGYPFWYWWNHWRRELRLLFFKATFPCP